VLLVLEALYCWEKEVTVDMSNIYIGNNTRIKGSVISSNTAVVGNEIVINGVELPPCPAEGRNVTVINNRVYIDGYEFVNGKWKKTLRALWHKWF
jgi:hypothetical protein